MPSENNAAKPIGVDYAANWASNEYDFQCPSGSWCRLQKIDPLMLIEDGLISQLDFITSVVVNEHVANAEMSTAQRVKAQRAQNGKTPAEIEAEVSEKAFSSMMEDPSKIGNLRQILDKVALKAVVIPVVHPAPKSRDQREDGLVYTDMITFEDKMAIFNSVMQGVKALEQFREVPGETVGNVASEPDVQPVAKRRTRAPSKRKTS